MFQMNGALVNIIFDTGEANQVLGKLANKDLATVIIVEEENTVSPFLLETLISMDNLFRPNLNCKVWVEVIDIHDFVFCF